jgi:MoaA/NifB/PqqE/SkfB family radical SAM enzyme
MKLELTHACNLRCDFCYTDSPRRTVERAIDLSDDAWRRVIAEGIELGVTEAVITGGEPLLRAPLALELLETLDRAGVATTISTNGWFVDDATADRLAALAARTTPGSTGPGPVADQLVSATDQLDGWREWSTEQVLPRP